MPTSVRTPRAARGWLAVACGVVLSVACSSEPGPSTDVAKAPTSEVEAPPPPRVRPPSGLGAEDHAPGFRWEAGTLAATGAAFESRVTGSGVEITPRVEGPLAPRGAPLALATTRVSRGARVLAEGVATPILDPSGTVLLRRGAITERFVNGGDGVEQSWLFERAPDGSGSLVVRVRASGESYTSATDHGLHFSSGGLGLRYGTSTWIDAAGKRTVVAPRFADGEIVLVVPEAVVATSQYPAVLDPTVTPEREIDLPLAGSTATGDQSYPSIAPTGSGQGYLAVWLDRRGLRPAIYATRLQTGTGNVLDETGIPIVQGVSTQTQPFIASAPGKGFIVVWAVSSVDLYQTPGVYAVRLDTNGTPLDKAPVRVGPAESNLGTATAAFDGTNFLVTWRRYSPTSSYDIAGARIGTTGGAIDAAPLQISNNTLTEYDPLTFFDGTDFFVIWRTTYILYGRKVAKDGTMPAAAVALVNAPSNYIYSFSAGFDGTQYLLAWNHYVSATSYDIFARRFDLNGAAKDAANIVVSNVAGTDDRPRVVADGSGFIVSFLRNSYYLMTTRVNADGTADAAATQILYSTSASLYEHTTASDGSGSIDVFREYGGSSLISYDVRGVAIGKPPAAATSFVVSRAANSETEPSTAWNGSNFLSVWLDTRDAGRTAVYGAVIGADGTSQPSKKIVSDTRYSSEFTRPRLASDGSGGFFMVFWAYDSTGGRRAIRGLRMDASGTPDATGVFTIWQPSDVNETNADLSIAYDGTNYLIVFQQVTVTGGSQSGISAIRMPATGTTPLDAQPIAITPKSQFETRSAPTVAFDGASYFIAWQLAKQSGSGISVSHIYGTRMTREGTVLDGEMTVCEAFLFQRAPFVAADRKNGGFFVVWEDYRTAIDAADVYGARVSAQGQLLDGTAGLKIAAAAHDESRPRATAAGDGLNWVVAWRDLRSKETYDIYGAWVAGATGKSFDPDGIVLSAEAGDEDLPWIDAATPGKMILAYQRLDPRTGYGSYRVKARAIDSGAPIGNACTDSAQCASRFCADGVCCSTACGQCGVCNAQPGTCTPRPAGYEAPACNGFKCGGALECPTQCATDAECSGSATCDQATKTCVSRIICVDDHTLKDLSGKLTDCGAYKCIGDACRTQCGSVDDCAAGFVCDQGQRCIKAPGGGDVGGCAVSTSSPDASGPSGLVLVGLAWTAASALARRRRDRRV